MRGAIVKLSRSYDFCVDKEAIVKLCKKYKCLPSHIRKEKASDILYLLLSD